MADLSNLSAEDLVAYKRMTDYLSEKFRNDYKIAEQDGREVDFDTVRRYKKNAIVREKLLDEMEERVQKLN